MSKTHLLVFGNMKQIPIKFDEGDTILAIQGQAMFERNVQAKL